MSPTIRVDLYTKVVLTVIAAALVCLCFKDTPVANAQAKQGPQQTAIAGGQAGGTSPVSVRIVGVQQGSWKDDNGKTVYEPWERLPVKQ